MGITNLIRDDKRISLKILFLTLFITLTLTSFVKAETTFFDNPDEFFIMHNQEQGSVSSIYDEESVGSNALSNKPGNDFVLGEGEKSKGEPLFAPIGRIFNKWPIMYTLFFIILIYSISAVFWTIFKLIRSQE